MRFNSKINPVPLKRLGAGYHSLDTGTKLASATGIRTAMANKDNISGLLPDKLPKHYKKPHNHRI